MSCIAYNSITIHTYKFIETRYVNKVIEKVSCNMLEGSRVTHYMYPNNGGGDK